MPKLTLQLQITALQASPCGGSRLRPAPTPPMPTPACASWCSAPTWAPPPLTRVSPMHEHQPLQLLVHDPASAAPARARRTAPGMLIAHGHPPYVCRWRLPIPPGCGCQGRCAGGGSWLGLLWVWWSCMCHSCKLGPPERSPRWSFRDILLLLNIDVSAIQGLICEAAGRSASS